jgi:hypothetical protein
MAPLSYRIEKGIYAIWHAFAVYWIARFSDQDYLDFVRWIGWEDSTSKLIAGITVIYGLWQACLFILHGIYNALLGSVLPWFNFGSYKQLLMMQFLESSPLPGITGYRNIDDVIRFREAKMGAISTRDGANLLVETAALDQIAGMTSGNYGRNHKQAAELLNAQLGAMSTRQGLEYMRGRKI